jgi:hypothetical protein
MPPPRLRPRYAPASPPEIRIGLPRAASARRMNSAPLLASRAAAVATASRAPPPGRRRSRKATGPPAPPCGLRDATAAGDHVALTRIDFHSARSRRPGLIHRQPGARSWSRCHDRDRGAADRALGCRLYEIGHGGASSSLRLVHHLEARRAADGGHVHMRGESIAVLEWNRGHNVRPLAYTSLRLVFSCATMIWSDLLMDRGFRGTRVSTRRSVARASIGGRNIDLALLCGSSGCRNKQHVQKRPTMDLTLYSRQARHAGAQAADAAHD